MKKLISLSLLTIFLVVQAMATSLPAFAEGEANASSSLNLDLGSSDRSMQAQGLFSGNSASSVAIQTGDVTRVVGATDLLTPAEFLAASQILAGGQQSLLLGASGQAIGGTFNLGSTLNNQTLQSLVVPQGVTGIHDFATGGNLSFLGNLTNAGSLYALSTNSQITQATISAGNIFNNAGGLISSLLPSGGLVGYGNAISNLSLILNAQNNIVNAGSIISSGNLTAIAGGSIINALPTGMTGAVPVMQAINNINLIAGSGNILNSGLITSQLNNINLATQLSQDMIINNIGGNLQALNGSINIRDMAFADKKHLVLWGGDAIAQELNLYSGEGIVNANLNDVVGTVNIYAGEAHMTAATDDLTLGTLAITGDPTFYNTLGNVTINTGMTFAGQPLAIVARGNISTSFGAGAINTSSASGNGGAITMIAGANFTSTGSNSVVPPAAGDTTSTLTITGGSSTGGYINLTSTVSITSLNSSSSATNGTGGNITLIAFDGSGTSAGRITLPTGVTINSSGNGSGNNGNVLVIAGETATNVTAITLGAINTNTNSGLAGTGDITIASATPTLPGGNVTILNGAITGGSFGVGTTQSADLVLNSLTAAGSTITIIAGENLDFNGSITNNGTGSASGGTVNITTNSGTQFRLGASTTNSISGSILANAGGSGGSGGTINITAGSGGVRLSDPTDLSVTATSGNGGYINIVSDGQFLTAGGTFDLNAAGTGNYTGGSLIVTTSSGNIRVAGGSNVAVVNANGIGNGDGGSITLTSGTNFAFANGKSWNINANGAGTGNGGTISLTSSNNGGDIFIDNSGDGSFSLSATGGSVSSAAGNGGTINLSTGDILNIDPAAITAGPLGTNGNGANFSFIAGTGTGNGTKAIMISSTLSANGAGTGNGGTIYLEAKDATNTLDIGSAVASNRITGNLTANAPGSGNGGSITIVNGNTSSSMTLNLSTGTVSATSGSGTMGTITVSQSGQAVNFTGNGTLSARVNSTGSNITFNLPNSAITLNNVTAGGSLNVTGLATTVFTGATTQASGDIAFSVSSLTNNGTLTTSNPSGVISVTRSSGSLTVTNNGTISLTGGGFSSLAFNAASGSTITFGGTGTITTQSTNDVISFDANSATGAITFSANTNQTINGGAYLWATAPSLTFGANVTLNAAGATYFDFSSGYRAYTVTLPDSSSVTINSGGGAGVWFGPYSANTAVFAKSAGAGTTTLNMNGGPVYIYGVGSSTTINSSVTLASNNDIYFSLDSNGSVVNNGTITSSANGGNITLESRATGFSLSGSGQITMTGTNGVIALSNQGPGQTLNINSSTTLNAGSTGQIQIISQNLNLANSVTLTAGGQSSLTITATSITLGTGTTITSTGTTGTAVSIVAYTNSLTITAPNASSSTISSSGGLISINQYALTFAKSAGVGTTTLNFNGGPTSFGTSIGNITVNSSLTLASNNNLTFNLPNSTSLVNNGTITSSANAGSITINGANNLTLSGSGGISVTGSGANSIGITAYNTGVTFASSSSFNAGSGGTVTLAASAGALSLNSSVTISTTGGSALVVKAPNINMGSGATLSSSKTTGTALTMASPIGYNLTITGPNASSASFATSGGNILIDAYGAMTFAQNGGVGGSTTLNFSGGNVTVNSNQTTTINSGVTLNSAKDIVINVNSITINSNGHVTTTNGNISLIAATGTLSIGSNTSVYANEGNLVIQNTDNAFGSITVASGTALDAYTLSNPSLGNVTVVVGNIPGTPVVGTAPGNVTVTETGGGKVYFGSNSINALGPSSPLQAIGRNIIFDTNGRPASAITIQGLTRIKADPPEQVASFGDASNLNLGSSYNASGSGIAGSSVISVDTLPTMNLIPNFNSVQTSLSPTPLQALSSGEYEAFLNDNSTDSISQPETAVNSGTNSDSSLTPIAFSHNLPSAQSLWQTDDVNLATVENKAGLHKFTANSAVRMLKDNSLDLVSGELLISAQNKTQVKVENLTIQVNAGAIALIKRKDGATIVRVLDESAKGSVQLLSGPNSTPIACGEEIILADDLHAVKQVINHSPIARRKTEHFKLAGGKSAAHSEVSLVSVMNNSQLFKALLDSRLEYNKAVGDRIKKTAACLMLITNTHGAYKVGDKN